MDKVVGIIRRIDDIGRITIPAEYIDVYGWGVGDCAISVMDDLIIVRKVEVGMMSPYLIVAIHKLDPLGRLTIPRKIRRSHFGSDPYAEVEIFGTIDAEIILRKPLQFKRTGFLR